VAGDGDLERPISIILILSILPILFEMESWKFVG
jgi:hypothetical protein